jgi:predicted dehydrogenase
MAASIPRRPRLFRSELDLLPAGVADAVILCTPHARHAEQIHHALEAGVHVLCEKPFVTRAHEAAALVEKAHERNALLYVAYTRRSRGHARFLLHAAQQIGPLTHVVVTRSQPGCNGTGAHGASAPPKAAVFCWMRVLPCLTCFCK